MEFRGKKVPWQLRVGVIERPDPTPAPRELAAKPVPRHRAHRVLLPDGSVFRGGGSVDGRLGRQP